MIFCKSTDYLCSIPVQAFFSEHKECRVFSNKEKVFVLRCCIAVAVSITLILLITGSHRVTVKIAQQLVDKRMSEIFESFDENCSYEIDALRKSAGIRVESVSKAGDAVEAECTVTSLNVGEPLTELLDSMNGTEITSDEYAKMIKDAVDSAEITSTSCTLLISIDSGGNPVLEDIPYEVYDAYLGGYLTYAQNAMKAMGGQFDD